MKQSRKELKKQYRQLYTEVREILFRHDPIGINFGSNTDEYEPEVDTILPRLVTAGSAEELRRVIYEEFVRWFTPEIAGSEANYDSVARDIWEAWQRHSLQYP